jgi:hypothetical protein
VTNYYKIIASRHIYYRVYLIKCQNTGMVLLHHQWAYNKYISTTQCIPYSKRTQTHSRTLHTTDHLVNNCYMTYTTRTLHRTVTGWWQPQRNSDFFREIMQLKTHVSVDIDYTRMQILSWSMLCVTEEARE